MERVSSEDVWLDSLLLEEPQPLLFRVPSEEFFENIFEEPLLTGQCSISSPLPNSFPASLDPGLHLPNQDLGETDWCLDLLNQSSGVNCQESFVVDAGSKASSVSNLESQSYINGYGSEAQVKAGGEQNGDGALLAQNLGAQGSHLTGQTSDEQSKYERRKLSDRESARRFELRKQKYITELEAKVLELEKLSTFWKETCIEALLVLFNIALAKDSETMIAKAKLAGKWLKCILTTNPMFRMMAGISTTMAKVPGHNTSLPKLNSTTPTIGVKISRTPVMEQVASQEHLRKRTCGGRSL